MNLFNPRAFLSKLFASSRANEEPDVETPVTFPQFARLPVELRLRIWEFAVEPRIHRIHLHSSCSPGQLHAQRSTSSNSDDAALYATETDGSPNVEDATESEGLDALPAVDYGTGWRYHMRITPCEGHPCNCYRPPPEILGAVPLPAVLSVCSESRKVARPLYARYIDQDYDSRGVVLRRAGTQPREPNTSLEYSRAGIILNPQIDVLLLPINIASGTGVRELQHFAAVAARNIPDISKVIIEISVSMPPFRWWSSARFEYWRNWGATSWWIPTGFLVYMRGLREVVLVRQFDRMLPDEWRDRLQGQWREEFLGVREKWPKEWDGTPPRLRFVQDLSEA